MTIHSSSLTAAQPIVSVKDGKVFANSRDVAEFFGKEHKNVLADIRELCSQLTAENSAVSFAPTSYPQKTGFGYRPMPAFDMTRDGFTLLAMGSTGKKALQFKLQYIEAFNRMEAKFKTAQPVPALPNFTDPAEAAIAWATEYKAKQLSIAQVMQELFGGRISRWYGKCCS